MINSEADDEFQAVAQICSTASMAHNLAQCKVVIQKAVTAGAKVRLQHRTRTFPNLEAD